MSRRSNFTTAQIRFCEGVVMSGVGHRAFALANSGGAKTGIGNAETGSISVALAECAKGISPRKTWGYLVGLIHVTERVAKHRVAVTREFTVDELALMLRSERGIDYLVTIMGDAEPMWWKKIKKHIAVAEAARMQSAARRKLQEAIDEDAELSAAISHAALLQDPDFYRAHADAERAVRAPRGALDRAMVQAAPNKRR